MGKLVFAIMFLFSSLAFAQDVNVLKNPNFESRTAQWSRTGAGTFTIESAAPLEGTYSANWDASATGEFFRSSTYTIPEGLKGRRCSIEMEYLWDSGVSGHLLLHVDDGSNNLVEYTIAPTTGGVSAKASTNFDCPTSGTIRVELESTADAASIRMDKMYLGSGKVFFAKPQDVFSAKVSNTGVVSDENIDWIDGNCSVAGTGLMDCSFKAGFFSNAPNCHANQDQTGSTVQGTNITLVTTSGYRARSHAGGGLNTQPHNVICQKVESSANRETVTLETSAASWSGYHDATCSFARTNTAYGAFTADATCNLVQTKNTGFGVVSAVGSVLPAITFTPTSSRRYYVCANALNTSSVASAEIGLRLTDGVNIISEKSYSRGDSAENDPDLCGFVDGSAGSALTLTIEGKVTSGSVTLDPLTSATGPIMWNIFAVDQQFPAPVFTELQNLVKSGSNGVKIYAARVTNAGTPTVVSEIGGDWIASTVDNGTGDVTLNLNAVFTETPVCVCTMEVATSGECVIDSGTAISSTTIRTQTVNSGGTASDNTIHIQCTGK